VFNLTEVRLHISELPGWQQLKKHIETSPQSSILVSTEEFEWLTKPGVIRDYLGELDYKIIIYIRRQDRYLESFYQTLVKGHQRISAPFPRWLNAVLNVWKIHDYQILLSRWAEVFGRENLVVRIFEKEAMRGLETGFLEILGLPEQVIESCVIPKSVWRQQFRESIDVRCLEVIRLANQVKVSQALQRKLLREMVDLSNRLVQAGEANKLLATAQERESIMSSVKDSNLAVSQLYLGGGGDMFSAGSFSNIEKLN